MATRNDEPVDGARREPLGRVGVRELKEHTSEVVRRVREDHETVDITFRGAVVAQLIPVHEPAFDQDVLERRWAGRHEMARHNGEGWTDGDSAVEAAGEGRSRRERDGGSGRSAVEERLEREDRRRELGEKLSKRWPKGVSAVDAIRDMRHDGW